MPGYDAARDCQLDRLRSRGVCPMDILLFKLYLHMKTQCKSSRIPGNEAARDCQLDRLCIYKGCMAYGHNFVLGKLQISPTAPFVANLTPQPNLQICQTDNLDDRSHSYVLAFFVGL